MSPAGLLHIAVVSLAFVATPGALSAGYSRARSEKPPFPVNGYTVTWAALVLLTLLVLAPAIVAGPAAGRETCAVGAVYPGCVLWFALPALWPLLIPSAFYLLVHAAVVFAPRTLRARFDRFNGELERERRKSDDGS
jgi:hypothetical protein